MDSISCPRCNSTQKFGLQTRVLDDTADLVEIFVACSKCRWQTVVERGIRRDLRLQRDLDRLRIRVLATQSESLRRVYEQRLRRQN